MNVLNQLRRTATAIQCQAAAMHDGPAKSELLLQAAILTEMRAVVAEHHDATAGVLGYRDDLHYQGLQDAFARVNGSQP